MPWPGIRLHVGSFGAEAGSIGTRIGPMRAIARSRIVHVGLLGASSTTLPPLPAWSRSHAVDVLVELGERALAPGVVLVVPLCA
ncbi:hypothetical protein AB0K15_13585 [Amycolatopsis sp. NPDC049253]|uniref:hypothetical protein n=1 Tax=Amycolatopsis sp. NPDC049253 TaxID=3155274 RepID=UPI003427A33E